MREDNWEQNDSGPRWTQSAQTHNSLQTGTNDLDWLRLVTRGIETVNGSRESSNARDQERTNKPTRLPAFLLQPTYDWLAPSTNRTNNADQQLITRTTSLRWSEPKPTPENGETYLNETNPDQKSSILKREKSRRLTSQADTV
ncbi:unnamed protein product [Calypogeia fissa]